MALSTTPFIPDAEERKHLNGPGDARPTWLQVLKDCNAIGKFKALWMNETRSYSYRKQIGRAEP